MKSIEHGIYYLVTVSLHISGSSLRNRDLLNISFLTQNLVKLDNEETQKGYIL